MSDRKSLSNGYNRIFQDLFAILDNKQCDLNSERDYLIIISKNLECFLNEKEAFLKILSNSREYKYLTIISEIHDGPLQELPSELNNFLMLINKTEDLELLRKTSNELIEKISKNLRDIKNVLLQIDCEIYPKSDLLTRLREEIRLAPLKALLVLDDNIDLGILQPEQFSLLIDFIKTALRNAHQHGPASEARIRIFRDDFHIIVEIEDNGKGFSFFPPQNLADFINLSDKGKLGLRLIYAKCVNLNANLIIYPGNSSLGGAKIELKILLDTKWSMHERSSRY